MATCVTTTIQSQANFYLGDQDVYRNLQADYMEKSVQESGGCKNYLCQYAPASLPSGFQIWSVAPSALPICTTCSNGVMSSDMPEDQSTTITKLYENNPPNCTTSRNINDSMGCFILITQNNSDCSYNSNLKGVGSAALPVGGFQAVAKYDCVIHGVYGHYSGNTRVEDGDIYTFPVFSPTLNNPAPPYANGWDVAVNAFGSFGLGTKEANSKPQFGAANIEFEGSLFSNLIYADSLNILKNAGVLDGNCDLNCGKWLSVTWTIDYVQEQVSVDGCNCKCDCSSNGGGSN